MFTIEQYITVNADDEPEAYEIAESVDCYNELDDSDFPISEIKSEMKTSVLEEAVDRLFTTPDQD